MPLELLFYGFGYELPRYENSVYLEVRNADEDNKLTYSLTAPMQNY